MLRDLEIKRTPTTHGQVVEKEAEELATRIECRVIDLRSRAELETDTPIRVWNSALFSEQASRSRPKQNSTPCAIPNSYNSPPRTVISDQRRADKGSPCAK
jgi:hypothetical protein